MIFFYIAMFSALFISVIAAWFSITGLVTIFPASKFSIMLMGSALELAKLVTASWLYRYWKQSPRGIKAYFSSAVLILSFITSIGIFGYLTRAHFDGTDLRGDTQDQVMLVDEQIEQYQVQQKTVRQQVDQINSAVASLSTAQRSASTVERAMRLRSTQKAERELLEKQIVALNDTINALKKTRVDLTSSARKLEAEVGPIRYIAELLFNASTEDSMDRAVRFMILLLVVVFDPLAILLVIAANIHLASLRAVSTQPSVGVVNAPIDIATSFEHVESPPILDKTTPPV